MQTRVNSADVAGARRGSLTPFLAFATSLSALLLLAFLPSNQAVAASRHAAMAIDANTGQTLHAEGADEPRHPASLTKMMTIYLVFEQLEAGRLMPWSKLKVSQEAASAAPTKLDLEPGEQIAVMDAVKALITKSANDMAVVLAEAIGGTEAKFAELMTQKARALGMRNTTFRNASGLPDSEQVTTARDMLTLALRLQDDFPKHYPLFATRAFTYNGATHRNHNTLLGTFEGIDGIKTGYTRTSGFNVVTSMRRGEKHIVAAVFGGATAGTRNATMRLMLTRALLKASTKKTRRPAPVLIARAKPATKPDAVATAAAPAPVPVAGKPKSAQVAAAQTPKQLVSQPKRAAEPVAVTAAAPAVEAQPETVAEAPAAQVVSETAAPAEAPTPIEIAKVRPVMVALRVRPVTAPLAAPPSPAPVVAAAEPPSAPEPEPTPAMSAAATALASTPAIGSGAPEPSRTTIIARQTPTPILRPSAPQQVAALQPVQAPQPLTRAIAAPVLVAPPVAIQRGAPPSTLQAQAQGLARSSAPAPTQLAYASAVPAPSRLRGPETTPAAASPTGGFQIQIGAYASVTEAERVLKETQARSQALLKSASMITTPVQKENRLIYRARFAGFDARSAADTCLKLRRAAVDCFVMKAD